MYSFKQKHTANKCFMSVGNSKNKDMTQDNFTVCWEFVFHVFFRQIKSRDTKILILNNWTQHCDSSADLIWVVFKRLNWGKLTRYLGKQSLISPNDGMCHLSNLAAGRKWWLLLGGAASCVARLEKDNIWRRLCLLSWNAFIIIIIISLTAIISTLPSSLRWKGSGVPEPHTHTHTRVSCRVKVQTGFNWIILDASDDGWRWRECNRFTFHLEKKKCFSGFQMFHFHSFL